METEVESTTQDHTDKALLSSSPYHNRPLLFKKLILGVILIVGIILSIVYRTEIQNALVVFSSWMSKNLLLGSFLFIILYAFATMAFIPGLILTITAGIVYSITMGILAGVALGTCVVFVGASIGAIAAFGLGRTLLRSLVEQYIRKYPKFEAIDRVIENQGFKLTFMLRLSPLVPFNAFNYLMGVTAVKFRDYLWACFGMIPGTIAYVFAGASLGTITNTDQIGKNPVVLIISIAGTILALGISIFVSIKAKQEINKIVEKSSE